MVKDNIVVLVVILKILLNLVSCAFSDCILLKNCADAQKYITFKRYEEKTAEILRGAHCGFEIIGKKREPKVFCDRIPKYPELPKNCIPFTQCSEAIELVNRSKYNLEIINLFKSSACGDSLRKDFIQCDKIKNWINSTNDTTTKLPLNDECGKKYPIPKIFSGKIAEPEEFPWIALLKYINRTNHIQYGCHGSLINKKYVLTAAHCLIVNDERKKKLGELNSVILGEYDTRTTIDCIFNDCLPPVQEFPIEHYLVHPKFNPNRFSNDIGLIRISGTVVFTTFVSPICLPINSFPLKKLEPLSIAGWGKIENNTMSNVLLKATIYLYTGDDCSEKILYTPESSELCAGSENGTDTCRGDSGGPLMANRKINRDVKMFLVGIVSWGPKCGSKAALYTNVMLFMDWILKNVRNY